MRRRHRQPVQPSEPRPCRDLKTGEKINAWVHSYAARRVEHCMKELEEKSAELEKLKQRLAIHEEAKAKATGQPSVVCFVDSNQGYGSTYAYFRCWGSKEAIAKHDEKGKAERFGTSTTGFMHSLMDEGIWCECLGEFVSDSQPYDLKVFGSEGSY